MARGEGRNKKKKDLNAENLKDASCQKLVLLNLFSESPIVVRSRCFQTDTSLKMVLVAETSCQIAEDVRVERKALRVTRPKLQQPIKFTFFYSLITSLGLTDDSVHYFSSSPFKTCFHSKTKTALHQWLQNSISLMNFLLITSCSHCRINI